MNRPLSASLLLLLSVATVLLSLAPCLAWDGRSFYASLRHILRKRRQAAGNALSQLFTLADTTVEESNDPLPALDITQRAEVVRIADLYEQLVAVWREVPLAVKRALLPRASDIDDHLLALETAVKSDSASLQPRLEELRRDLPRLRAMLLQDLKAVLSVKQTDSFSRLIDELQQALDEVRDEERRDLSED